ncbi:LuxR C-terminal-related transcriptional regulator [Streptomyces sp. NBC_00987]|uniref:LuxR C-terminal-related transcriptional regulator n=1 Tax=Streptomyces sp. NBC_00987 TaxID=2903703 RepID=UPI00386B83D0|nr:helix-turn-helix transcriptional regulator [Streptomyces sp. NBC_00987]
MTSPLTGRQREVLLLAANGNTAGHIAHWLGVSANTVNETLVRAYRALGVHDRAQAVAVALKVGEFGLDDIHAPITEQQPTI